MILNQDHKQFYHLKNVVFDIEFLEFNMAKDLEFLKGLINYNDILLVYFEIFD